MMVPRSFTCQPNVHITMFVILCHSWHSSGSMMTTELINSYLLSLRRIHQLHYIPRYLPSQRYFVLCLSIPPVYLDLGYYWALIFHGRFIRFEGKCAIGPNWVNMCSYTAVAYIMLPYRHLVMRNYFAQSIGTRSLFSCTTFISVRAIKEIIFEIGGQMGYLLLFPIWRWVLKLTLMIPKYNARLPIPSVDNL